MTTSFADTNMLLVSSILSTETKEANNCYVRDRVEHTGLFFCKFARSYKFEP